MDAGWIERVDYDAAYSPAEGAGDGAGCPAPTRSGPEPLLDLALQGRFCAELALHGNVRLACRAVKVSPQTAYRMRRAAPTFRTLWNAALVIARDQVEDVLADRAINGWEEAVFYHGEEVARRRRYDSRLLLAHLGRLDKLAERADTALAVALFDDALDALHAGAEPVLPQVAEVAAEVAQQAPPAAEAAAAPAPVEDDENTRVPLLEARLRWLEAHHGPLRAGEAAQLLHDTVPGVPGSALRPYGWRGPDDLTGLPDNAVGEDLVAAAGGAVAAGGAGPGPEAGPAVSPAAARC